MTMRPLDLDHLRTWIGKAETRSDTVTPRLAESLAAVLDRPAPASGEAAVAPLGVHWCLAPATAQTRDLGEDGHPARGGFLPPVPLPRRMWAGSQTTFKDQLRVGDEVRRTSRVADVVLKEGRRGPLCFVTVDHVFETGRGVAIEERQDIVYHDLAPAIDKRPGEAAASGTRSVDAVLLFRYSALTFNGHRIHYDRAYAIEREGYPGLVVHGPLQATLLMQRAAEERGGTPPRRFSFRGLQPLIEGEPFSLSCEAGPEGADLWVEAEGRRTMQARAEW
jgi:3-methylfumaryl-CoA hydratase